jgi:replicative DNA helicase
MAEELNFEGLEGRLPPQNIEAEESILGGILLDPEAIGRIAELLLPDAFYISSHTTIYHTMLFLHGQGLPTDLISVASRLSDLGQLAAIGGQAKLVQLVDRTVSAVNIDRYAALVMDKYLRRQLIQAGREIDAMGYDTATDLEVVLDRAEQKVFNVTQKRPQQDLVPIYETLVGTFEDIEAKHESQAQPGILTDFYDFDAMTGGLQPSDLIIVAGRPSMGKCLHETTQILQADGRLVSIGELYRQQHADLLTLGDDWKLHRTQPSQFIDDGIKPVFRVTTQLGRQVETTLTHPFLTIDGWRPLSELQVGDRVAVPRVLPVFGSQSLPKSELDQLIQTIKTQPQNCEGLPSIVFQLNSKQLHYVLVRLCDRFPEVRLLEEVRLLSNAGHHFSLALAKASTTEKTDEEFSYAYVSLNKKNVQQIQHLCLRFGIITKIVRKKLENTNFWCLEILNFVDCDLQKGDVYWDAITDVEYIGDRQVYDLTIPETHNFIADDICVHNTAVSLNIAQNIAKTYRLPIAIFSLEMSKEQLVQRLLSSEAGIEANRLRAGRVSQNEWEPFNNALTSLSEMPIFIDDTPNIVVSEIRSKCRRLQAEQGQNLGLVLLDYLQLMEGGGDNRVQELSRITRSLKGLARELNVPVIALSQLSRGVEARTNKRPMMSDLRESGCLAGDTLVTLTSGERVPIRDLVDRENVQVWALDEQDFKLKPASVSHAFSTGIKLIYRLTTRLGRTIDATANHKFRVLDGWVRLDELHVDSRIALPRSITNTTQQDILSPEELAFLGHLIGDGCTLPRRSIQYTTKEFELAAIVQDLAIAIFGSSINPRIVKERSWYQVYFPASERLTHGVRNPITAWLDNLGIFGLRSYEKKLPRILFQQSNDAISKFLRHLWCTDGCLNLIRGRSIRPVAYYATSSITLATDVQSLLLRLGIIARLKLISQGNKGRDHYHVTITGKQDIEIFLERVATVGIRRTQTANEIRDHLKSKVANTNRDVIPRDIWSDLVLPVLEASSFTHRQFQTTLGQSYCGSTLYRQNLSRERALKIANVLNCSSLKLLSESDIYWDEIASIEPIGETDVYDLTVPGFHNFVANDIVVHNSIEQDADLIVMLYRDEYYNPDTPDRGITEMIIAKHRNGPTGIVKLLFESQYTRFRNMAGGFQAGSLNPNQPGQLPPM